MSFDPREVPILGELEEEFRRMVGEALGPPAPAPAPVTAAPAPRPAPRVPPRPEPWLRTGRRIVRRAAVAGALVGVVGATALATKSVVGHDPDGPVVLQHAGGREVALRRYHGRLCLDISFAAGVASRCAPAPAAGAVAPLSAQTPGGRVVAGVAGTAVAAVRVQSGGHAIEVATRRVGRGPAARLRWFTAVLPAGQHAEAAVLEPRRASGAPAGHRVADCTLGSAASCRAAQASARARTQGGPLVNEP